MNMTADADEVLKIINGESHDPYTVLGMHPVTGANGKGRGIVFRAYFPNAREINVVKAADSTRYPMEKIYEAGFFEAFLANKRKLFTYTLEVTDLTDSTFSIHDPYCFLPVLTDYDLHLFGEGNHHKIFERLGSHVMAIDGIRGTLFAVWAPCARRVSVVGDFNRWDGRRHAMRRLGCSGVWEIFLPGVGHGDKYKYEIKTPGGEIYLKADPYAFYSELRPLTASIVYDFSAYRWNDGVWIRERDADDILKKPVSIYEVHLGSWDRISPQGDNGIRQGRSVTDEGDYFLTYREMAERLVPYVKEMNYTHIEFLPVAEHPFDGSWGYQITGYYAITSRYGTPEDFMFLVDECHRSGIGVIVDWVPSHFPKDGHGLARFDGTALYEHADRRQGEQPDWGTHLFNYGRHEVRNFLISNALFLFEKYHIDGLRVDAVASMLYLDFGKRPGEWVPNCWGGRENTDAVNFLHQLNTAVYRHFPGIMMIAEESTAWALVTKPPYAGGLGFTFKWNMGWMNDFLRYISMDSVYRKYHHDKMTFSIMYAMSENFIQVLSHDEVVHGKCSMINKMPGDYRQKFAGLRASYGYMYGHPGKKLLFMGGEFGQFIEWDYKKPLDWFLLDYDMHGKMQRYVRDLNRLYLDEKAMYEDDYSYKGFEWLDCNDNEHSIFSFLRKGTDKRDMLIFICNFTPVVHEYYRIGVPFSLYYREIFNSDSEVYGGSNVGNLGGVRAEHFSWQSRPYSLNLRVPSYGMLVFKPVFEETFETAGKNPEAVEEVT